MPKRGAYLRDNPTEPEAKSHFIREWRERPTEKFPNGMTQPELAERAELSPGAISAYERGEYDPSLEALQKLSAALGVPKGMITDIDPREQPSLWDAYLRADATTRIAMNKMAAGLVQPVPPSKPKRRR